MKNLTYHMPCVIQDKIFLTISFVDFFSRKWTTYTPHTFPVKTNNQQFSLREIFIPLFIQWSIRFWFINCEIKCFVIVTCEKKETNKIILLYRATNKQNIQTDIFSYLSTNTYVVL